MVQLHIKSIQTDNFWPKVQSNPLCLNGKVSSQVYYLHIKSACQNCTYFFQGDSLKNELFLIWLTCNQISQNDSLSQLSQWFLPIDSPFKYTLLYVIISWGHIIWLEKEEYSEVVPPPVAIQYRLSNTDP